MIEILKEENVVKIIC